MKKFLTGKQKSMHARLHERKMNVSASSVYIFANKRTDRGLIGRTWSAAKRSLENKRESLLPICVRETEIVAAKNPL